MEEIVIGSVLCMKIEMNVNTVYENEKSLYSTLIYIPQFYNKRNIYIDKIYYHIHDSYLQSHQNPVHILKVE